MALFKELEKEALASIRLAFPEGYRISISTSNPLLLSRTTMSSNKRNQVTIEDKRCQTIDANFSGQLIKSK